MRQAKQRRAMNPRTPRVILGVEHENLKPVIVGYRKMKKGTKRPIRRWVHTGNVQKLLPYLDKLKKQGITRVGVEAPVDSLEHGEPVERDASGDRWLLTVYHHARRKGITIEPIEDADAWEISYAVESASPGGYIELEHKQMRFKAPATKEELKELWYATVYFRSIKMFENMRRKKLRVAIIGDYHAIELGAPHREMIHLVSSTPGEREEIRGRGRKAFKKYARLFVMMYNQIKRAN